MPKKSNLIVLSGLFIAIGVALPMAFHAISWGKIFSPMHLPILLSGFFLPPLYAGFCGLITPIISSILTGMPALFPVAPYMAVELAVYGIITNIFDRKFKFNIYASLLLAMIAGRMAAGFAVWVLIKFFAAKIPGPSIFIMGTFTKTAPGMIAQLLILPPIIQALRNK